MRRKYQFWLHFALILLLIVITATVNLSPVSANPTALIVNPPTIIDTSKTPGTTFTVNVDVDDAYKLVGFEFKLKFDPTVLNVPDTTTIINTVPILSKITLGNFFGGPATIGPAAGGPSIILYNETNNELGYVWYAVTFGTSSPSFTNGKSGSGTLATIEFTVEDYGTTPLDLVDTELTNYLGNKISHEVFDGYFSNTGYCTPVADFTFTPASPILGETVTFNAAYDPTTGSGSRDFDGYIVSWEWDFGDGSSGSGETVYHTYTDAGGGTQTVTLTVTDDSGYTNTATKSVPLSGHNIAVIDVQPNQTFVIQTHAISINVTVKNKGSFSEIFNVTACYNGIPVAPLKTTSLFKNTNTTLTFYWKTSGIAAGPYEISANASQFLSEENILDDNTLPYGTVTVRVLPVASFDYSPKLPEVLVTVTFDASDSYDPDGTITSYEWDFGDGNTGTGITTTHIYLYEGAYTVKLTVVDDDGLSSTTEKSVAVGRGTIEIEADVGTIHFVGEKAEFYVLVKFLGTPLNPTSLTAKLYGPDGKIAYYQYPQNISFVDTGLYRLLWGPIPKTASGTYTVLIQASYFTLKDSAIKSFLISKTLTDWNPLLIRIDGTVGTIKTDVGLIKLNLKDINATLTEIIVDSKGETLAKIDSAVGTITAKLKDINATLTEIIVDNQGDILAKIDSAIGSVTTTLDTINAKVVAIDGNVATIETDVGTIKTDVATLKTSGVPTTPLYVTSVFSAIAAIIALIVLFVLRRRKPT